MRKRWGMARKRWRVRKDTPTPGAAASIASCPMRKARTKDKRGEPAFVRCLWWPARSALTPPKPALTAKNRRDDHRQPGLLSRRSPVGRRPRSSTCVGQTLLPSRIRTENALLSVVWPAGGSRVDGIRRGIRRFGGGMKRTPRNSLDCCRAHFAGARFPQTITWILVAHLLECCRLDKGSPLDFCRRLK